jgi:uncharacterized protein
VEHFFLRLNPPRPSFAAEMSDEEQALMQRHVAYWSGHFEGGSVVVFGPVADPAGGWGVAVVKAENEAAVRELIASDPVITSGDGFSYEVFEMPGAIS